MNPPPLVLGIDVGTSGTKVLAVDAAGVVVASALEGHPGSSPQAGWSEQRPEDWVGSTIRGIKAVLEHPVVAASEVVSIGLTGQMHGLVALNGAGEVVVMHKQDLKVFEGADAGTESSADAGEADEKFLKICEGEETFGERSSDAWVAVQVDDLEGLGLTDLFRNDAAEIILLKGQEPEVSAGREDV